jgi:subtilisin family serine protease
MTRSRLLPAGVAALLASTFLALVASAAPRADGGNKTWTTPSVVAAEAGRAGGSLPSAGRPAAVSGEVLRSVAATGRAEVLVLLRDLTDDAAPTSALESAAAAVRDRTLDDLAPTGFVERTRYEALPILAGTVDQQALDVLSAHPLVVSVEEDGWMVPIARSVPTGDRSRQVQGLTEAVKVVGADVVRRQYGLTGKGVTVAVLDTGIDNEHADFEGRIVDQYCYSSSRSCGANDVAEAPDAQDEAGHGTAVTGIIASAGAVSPVGVAPEASIVAVRVFQDGGGASTSDIIKGLDFVLRKQAEHQIRIVNMSLGGGSGRGVNCDDQNRSMKEAFQRLVARQVTIFVATGNDGIPDEVSSPACISNSTAVGATYDGEFENGGRYCPDQKDVTSLTIACFTNRGRAMDILAPGLFIRSSRLGGGVTSAGAGTSYASPMAAGVAALLLQADAELRPSEVERTLQTTGRTVKHLENDDTFPLVDALRAVEAVLPATPTALATTAPPATPTRQPTPTRTPSGGSETPVTPTEPPTVEVTASATVRVTATATPRATPGDEGARLFLPALYDRVAR